MKSAHTLEAIGFATVILALGVIGCTGGSGQTFDPKRAVELTHAALISAADLPGSGWAVTENDSFLDITALPPVAACDSVRSVIAEREQRSTGRAQRRLEQGRGPAVEVEIEAYDSSDGLKDVLNRVQKELIAKGTLLTCFTEAVKVERGDILASFTASVPSAKAPGGGVAFADDRNLAVPGGRVIVHHEGYIWLKGNVSITVDVVAVRDRFTADLVNAALQKTAAAVEKASQSQ